MTVTLQHSTNGQHVAGHGERSAPVYNPATGAVNTEVALANADNTRAAIEVSGSSYRLRQEGHQGHLKVKIVVFTGNFGRHTKSTSTPKSLRHT